MQVITNVTLADGDRFGMTTEEAAKAVLAALGGDLDKDSCQLTVMAPTGSVGMPPTAPVLPPPEVGVPVSEVLP